MPDQPAFTRREFVHTAAIISTIATMPAFLHRSALAMADPRDAPLTRSRPSIPDDRILVVIQLSGGNDGLNTVIPFGENAYYNARPNIAIPEDQVLVLDQRRGIGLHPQLAALKDMIDEGQAAVVMGAGYPNPNRSHFASMDIYHTGDTQSGASLGWVGQAMDQAAPETGSALIAIGSEAPLAGYGRKTQPVAFESPNLFRWSGADLHDSLGRQYDTINRAGVLSDANVGANEQMAFVMRTSLDAQLASDQIRNAVGRDPLTSFPGGQLANQLRMVAAMIRADLPTRVYYVGMGGFDTHANQPGRHSNLLTQFGDAMRAFYNELAAMRQQHRVLSLAFSEFGRRVAQNASQGTDHGTAGPMFLFGPMVLPGLQGTHPAFDRLDEGDLAYTVDFRGVYAAVLDQWLKVDSREVLGRQYGIAKVLDRRHVA